jgi:hypothetical protein
MELLEEVTSKVVTSGLFAENLLLFSALRADTQPD